LLKYNSYGFLEPGVYDLNWEDFKEIFTFNNHRKKLFAGLELAISELRAVGCSQVYINGSFITRKEFPEDFDICWDEENVNLELLTRSYRGLIDFGHKMKTIKQRYGGDIVPMTSIADEKKGIIFLWFFQEDRQGRQKGIIRISL